MDKEQTAAMLQLLLSSKAGRDQPMQDDPMVRDLFHAKVAFKRIETYPLPFQWSSSFFLMSLLTFIKGPAHIMATLWLSKCYCEKMDKAKGYMLTIEDWANIFPFGAPTQEEFETWWDSQKCERRNGGMDNLVDYVEEWGLPAKEVTIQEVDV